MRIVLITLVAFFCFVADSLADDKPFTLYESASQCGYADWSPDGEIIVFTAGGTETEEGNLWIMPASGGEPWQLTENGGHHGNFSPDGAYMAYDAEQGSIIRIIPVTGGVPVRIVPETIPVVRSGNPCWSPDGTQIAFRSEEELYTLDLPTGELAVAFQQSGFLPMPIQWVGDVIVTSLIDKEKETAFLWKIPVDGSAPIQLTDAGRTTQASVSPNGKFIVYTTILSREVQEYDLRVMPFTGGMSIKLTDDPDSFDLTPCWSPAGDQIVYMHYDGELGRIQIMDVDILELEQHLNAANAP